MISRQSDDPSSKDHQIALPNIRSYPDVSEKDDEEDERVDVVGTTEAPHGNYPN